MTAVTQKAADLFTGGKYCSQAVLGAFCEKYGMDIDAAFKVSCGLNSGCRKADVCGAVSGAILVIGLKYGDNQQICNAKTEEFLTAFAAERGSIICRELLGCDISTSDGAKEFADKDLYHTVCVELVKCAAGILEDIGY